MGLRGSDRTESRDLKVGYAGRGLGTMVSFSMALMAAVMQRGSGRLAFCGVLQGRACSLLGFVHVFWLAYRWDEETVLV